jgi:AcrR family transcriptional regulator
VIKPPDVRRTELLDAAAALFERDGYDDVTVAAIAAAAKVAKGTFYLYFDSKEELVEALRHRLTDRALGPLRDLRPPIRRGEWRAYTERLVEVAIGTQLAAQTEHDLLRVLPHSHHSRTGPHEPADPIRAALHDVIEAGGAAGAYRVTNPAEASALLYVLLHAAGDEACARPDQLDAITQAATEIVRRALFGNDPG